MAGGGDRHSVSGWRPKIGSGCLQDGECCRCARFPALVGLWIHERAGRSAVLSSDRRGRRVVVGRVGTWGLCSGRAMAWGRPRARVRGLFGCWCVVLGGGRGGGVWAVGVGGEGGRACGGRARVRRERFRPAGRPANNVPNPTPTPVGLPGDIGPVTQVAASGAHSLVVTASGQLYAFGSNFWGQLGSSANNVPDPTPTVVGVPGEVGPVTEVAAGGGHSLAVTASGQLYASVTTDPVSWAARQTTSRIRRRGWSRCRARSVR